MEPLLAWLSHYGYAGLFGLLALGIVGLPIPNETLLVFSGYLIFKGRLQAGLTFAAAFGGGACGISLSYLIGRTVGYKVVSRYGKYLRITPERLERVHRWFQSIGDWLLAIGYFIPGVRHVTALIAGMSHLEYRTFALFAYSGAAVWTGLFLLLGYLVGENWQAALGLIHRYVLLFTLLLVCVAGAAVVDSRSAVGSAPVMTRFSHSRFVIHLT